MRCTVCGAAMRPVRTDLPFKTGEQSIVILRDLPVQQCDNCSHYLLEDAVLARVDAILDQTASDAELEIVRFAA